MSLVGDLRVCQEFCDSPKAPYERELDLRTGLITTRSPWYGNLTRELFAHAKLPVICLRQSYDHALSAPLYVSVNRVFDPECRIETFGNEALSEESPLIEAFIAEATIAA